MTQFTRWAENYATHPALTNAEALSLLWRVSGAGPEDELLDVACGPGVVVCASAAIVRRAVGVDITPAMIARAEAMGREKELSNVAWHLGDAHSLPFPPDSFSVVLSRYAMHHLAKPGLALEEMLRVCRPGGRLVVVDLHAPEETDRAAALNEMECLRDPSHVRALPMSQWRALAHAAGWGEPTSEFYDLDWEVDDLLRGSAIAGEQAAHLRGMLIRDLRENRTGLNVRMSGAGPWLTFPIAVMAASKPA